MQSNSPQTRLSQFPEAKDGFSSTLDFQVNSSPDKRYSFEDEFEFLHPGWRCGANEWRNGENVPLRLDRPSTGPSRPQVIPGPEVPLTAFEGLAEEGVGIKCVGLNRQPP